MFVPIQGSDDEGKDRPYRSVVLPGETGWQIGSPGGFIEFVVDEVRRCINVALHDERTS